ncbi:MAG: hypothetical protein AAB834_00625 [Patescibacteria group bacterium]
MATYFIHQKITPFANQYRIFDAQDSGPGKLRAFAHQKRLALKEKFIFFTDETKQTPAFQLQARKIIDLGAAYDVQDEQGETIGILKKQFQQSFFRSTWHLHTPGNEAVPFLIAQERSMPLAVLRRIWGFVPLFGEFPFFLKYHFDFIDPGTHETVGEYNKIELIRDHYKLTVQDSYLKTCDWRTFVSLGVVMDALQSR